MKLVTPPCRAVSKQPVDCLRPAEPYADNRQLAYAPRRAVGKQPAACLRPPPSRGQPTGRLPTPPAGP